MKTKLTLLVAVLFVVLLGTGCASSLKEGLVAHYPFNGNVLDESGESNHGTVKGTLVASMDRHGIKDKAYNFNKGYIHVDNDSSLQMSEQLTICAWVKNPGGQPTVLGKWRQDGKTWSYCLYVGTGGDTRARFLLHDGQRGGGDNFVELSGWNLVKREHWNHLVATYDGQFAKVYINGKMEATASTNNEKIHVNGNPVTIGTDGYGLRYTGEMDDIRIYNRALSAEEVKALYDLEKPKK